MTRAAVCAPQVMRGEGRFRAKRKLQLVDNNGQLSCDEEMCGLQVRTTDEAYESRGSVDLPAWTVGLAGEVGECFRGGEGTWNRGWGVGSSGGVLSVQATAGDALLSCDEDEVEGTPDLQVKFCMRRYWGQDRSQGLRGRWVKAERGEHTEGGEHTCCSRMRAEGCGKEP